MISLRKYLRRLVWLSLLPLFFVSGYLATDNILAANEKRQVDATSLLHNVAVTINARVAAQISALQVIADSPSLDGSPDLAAFYEVALAYREEFGGHVILADLESRMLLNTRVPLGKPLPRLPVPKGRAAVPIVLESGEPAVGDSFIGPIAQERLVAIVVPVLRGGETTGLLLSIIETRQFQELFDNLISHANFAIALFDSAGTQLAVKPWNDFSPHADGEERGAEQLVARLDNAPWVLVVEESPDFHTASLVEVAQILVLTVILGAIIGVTAGNLAGNKLRREISLLNSHGSGINSPSTIEDIENIRQRILQEIDVREKAEIQRSATERHFQEIYDETAEAIFVLTPEFRFMDANPEGLRLFGYDIHELRALTVADVLTEREQRRFASTIATTPRESPHMGEWEHRRKDGSTFIAEVRASPVNDERIVAVVRDMTERLTAERRLKESEARFRSIIEQSITAVFITQDDRVVYANPYFCEIMGYPVSELLGRSSDAFISSEDREQRLEAHNGLLRGGKDSARFEVRAYRNDGSEFVLGVHSTRIVFNDQTALLCVAQDITERQRAREQIENYVNELESAIQGTVQSISSMMDKRDPYTAGHQRRVGEIAAAIALEMGFDENAIKGIRIAGSIHDIGKIAIPAEILSKPTKLTNIEYDLIKTHTTIGYEILRDVKFSWPITDVIHQHHEHFDGSGYPNGLRGDEIIVEARIMSVADVIEAIASHRPYRPALGLEVALAEIERNRGKFYDPDVAEACLRLFREKGFVLPD